MTYLWAAGIVIGLAALAGLVRHYVQADRDRP